MKICDLYSHLGDQYPARLAKVPGFQYLVANLDYVQCRRSSSLGTTTLSPLGMTNFPASGAEIEFRVSPD